MRRFGLILMVVLISSVSSITNASVIFQNLGTGAPPATLGPFTVAPFDTVPQTAIADFALVTTIPGSPIPGNLTTSIQVEKDTVPTSWSTWSHGYTGPVYWTNLNTSVTLTLPPNTGAFRFHAEPTSLGNFVISATTNNGTTSGNITVNGNGGANGFAFYTTLPGEFISTITVTSTDTNGFAIGEFGAAQALFSPAIPAPTMTEWGILSLILLLGVVSIWSLKKKRFVA